MRSTSTTCPSIFTDLLTVVTIRHTILKSHVLIHDWPLLTIKRSSGLKFLYVVNSDAGGTSEILKNMDIATIIKTRDIGKKTRMRFNMAIRRALNKNCKIKIASVLGTSKLPLPYRSSARPVSFYKIVYISIILKQPQRDNFTPKYITPFKF